jgi:glycosyltransferase involved in cell wall biosynthesis
MQGSVGCLEDYRLLMKQIIHHWLPSSALGGIEMAALTLIQVTPDVRHVVATGEVSGPAVELWRAAGAEVIHISGWHGTLGLSWHRHWKAFVRQRGVRQLIAWSPTRLPQLLSPLGKHARCVVHLGNVGGFSRRSRWKYSMMTMAYRPACRPTLIACSQAVATSLEDEPALLGLLRIVVPNPVRYTFFELGAARPSLRSAPKVWGMLARLDVLKDHRSLIEAVRRLPVEVEFRLEIAGAGVLEGELRKQVSEAGLERRIRFLGALTQPQEAMRKWEAFVFATTAGEGFGIAVAEAMASGLPCVLTDVPALREVAGSCAYYAAPSSPADLCARILEVIGNPALAQARAEEGRQRAQELFAAETFARRYLSALEHA